EGDKVLRISADGFALVNNGTDGIWLEHPRGEPMPWKADADWREGLQLFKKYLVDTVASPSEGARYLMIAALALFPLLRHRVKVRPIIEVGGTSGKGGDGKTSN